MELAIAEQRKLVHIRVQHLHDPEEVEITMTDVTQRQTIIAAITPEAAASLIEQIRMSLWCLRVRDGDNETH